ncbi:MAG TPA: hypothetical protein VN428_02415 [Bryobacteraceae bacterium]|nr:hypothetical protein [Bryobacteraceae bacterium]
MAAYQVPMRRTNRIPRGSSAAQYQADVLDAPAVEPTNYAPNEGYAFTDAPAAQPAYTYDAGGPATYSPDLTTTDPYERFTQDRTSWYDRGNRIDEDLRGETGYRRGLEEGYRSDMDAAAQGLRDTPGYTADEQAGIMREGDVNSLLNVDYGGNYLTPGENEAITGNPYASNNEWTRHLSDAMNQQEGQLASNIQQTREGMDKAIDPTQLALSQEYRTNQDAVLNTTSDNVYDAIDPTKLSMDSEYARQAGMTDAEVDEAAQAGARNVGARYRSAIGDLERSAAESGNASPLAIAAGRARLERQSATDAADATVRARLAARAEQRDAATGVEGTRLGAEQTYAGLRSGAAMDLGNLASDAVGQREGLRSAAVRDISDRQMDAASTTGKMAQDAAQYAGDSRLSNEQQIANRATQAEQEASDRAAMTATNRQATSLTNQANKFDRGFGANEALSGRTKTTGDARIAGRNTYLDLTANQTNANAELGSTARGQRVSNFGTQAGAVNTATGNNADYDLRRRGQSFGTNFKSSLGGTLGKTLGDPVGLYNKAKTGK